MVPTPQDPLLRVQEVLNGTEVNLQHLTALVDCVFPQARNMPAFMLFCPFLVFSTDVIIVTEG